MYNLINMNIIELKNIKKSFGKNEVLKDVTFNIKQGERIAILGPNGSGKSTLLNIMLGLLRQSSGKISFPAYDDSMKDFLSDMGIQFQSGNFPSGFKVKEVIEVCMEQSSNFNYKDYKDWKKEANNKLNEYLEIFQIDKIKNNKVNAISGGQKQRLNILIALISNPKILILDEISSGLDIGSQKQIMKFISDYVKDNKATLIIVSHILFEIQELTNKVLMLDEGKIMFDYKISELEKKHGSLSNALDKYFIKGNKEI